MARSRFIESITDILKSWGWSPLGASSTKDQGAQLEVHMCVDGSDVHFGTLSQEEGEYVFRYSAAFRAQQEIPAISAFPDKDREYRSQNLWPFFEVRLPPEKRPDVQRALEEKGIDPRDTFRILAELGGKTATTPYELRLQSRDSQASDPVFAT